MEAKLINKFTDEVVTELLRRFNLYLSEVEFVGSHQSFVYKAAIDEENVYIRITASSHRKLSQLKAEIEMILYLDKNGFEVAMPLVSENGNYIESYHSDNMVFYAVVFEEAEGLGIGKYPWSIEVPKRVGIMNAELHELLSSYVPQGSLRPEWWENTFLIDAEKYLPDNHEKVLDVINSLVFEIKRLPKNIDNYGLTHGDMVACNYNMTDDKITLFDFDEASYCWYVNDIAVNLFYEALGWKGIVDVSDAIEAFESYISGYSSIRTIDSYLISKLGLFLKLREVILYVAIHRSRDINNLDMWSKNFMDGRKEKLENNIPFIDINFQEYI